MSSPSEPVLKSPAASHRRERSVDNVVFTDNTNQMGIPSFSPPSKLRAAASSASSTLSRYTGLSPVGPRDVNSVLASNEALKQALEFEEMETDKLERQLKDQRSKLSSSLAHQSRLEQDLESGHDLIEALRSELKAAKKARQLAEDQLSQEQMTGINEKQTWLDKEAGLMKTIGMLKAESQVHKSHSPPESIAEHADDDAHSSAIDSTSVSSLPYLSAPVAGDGISRAPSPAARSGSFGQSFFSRGSHAPSQSSNNHGTVDKLNYELQVVKQQLELVSKEYALRHDRVKEEMEEVKLLNGRLMDENEGFQILLAQKTVMGGFASLADELDASDSKSRSEDSDDGSMTNDNGDGTEVTRKGEESEAQERLKRDIFALKFEVDSLKNHNRALKLSLERLVKRLLEYEEFEKVVEGSEAKVTSRSISLFHRRVSDQQGNEKRRASSSVSNGSHYISNGTLPRIDVTKRQTLSHSLYDGSGTPSPSSWEHGRGPQFFGSPAPSSFGIRGINRIVKPPSTWSSIIFTNHDQHSTNGGGNGIGGGGVSSGSESQSATSSPRVAAVSSSIESTGSVDSQQMSSLGTDDSISSILNGDHARRPSTYGQKKLRPLKLALPSPPAPSSDNWGPGGSDSTAHAGEQGLLTPAGAPSLSTSNSTWSFSLHS